MLKQGAQTLRMRSPIRVTKAGESVAPSAGFKTRAVRRETEAASSRCTCLKFGGSKNGGHNGRGPRLSPVRSDAGAQRRSAAAERCAGPRGTLWQTGDSARSRLDLQMGLRALLFLNRLRWVVQPGARTRSPGSSLGMRQSYVCASPGYSDQKLHGDSEFDGLVSGRTRQDRR